MADYHHLVCFAVALFVAAGHASPERRTKYGCEGTTLHIECEEGTVINLVRANYGRFSISICNDVGNTDWSVNCMEPRTLRVINARCDAQPHCEIPVDSSLFGDPCPGTHKYVEVHYTCEAVRTAKTTAKPLPPWLLDLAATPATTSTSTSTTTSTPTSSTTTTTASTPAPIAAKSNNNNAPSTTSTSARPATETNEITAIVTDAAAAEETDLGEEGDLEIVEVMLGHCAPRTSRNLFWNWTEHGREAIQVCPPGSAGFARWTCGADGAWTDAAGPDLSECQSMWLSRLESRMHAVGSIDAIANEISALTESKALYGGDIPIVTNVMQGLAHRLHQELYVVPSQEEKETRVTELLRNVLRTASNLLGDAQTSAWADLQSEEKRAAHATSLMLGVEENAFLLAEIVNNEKKLAESTANILSSVRVMRARDVDDQLFPHLEASTSQDVDEAKLLVTANALTETSANGAVRLAFQLYNNLERVLPGMSGTHFVNSRVLSVSVSPRGRTPRLTTTSPVVFAVRHLQSENVRNAVCAAWDYSGRVWSTADCSVVKSNATHTTCKCFALSAYAVLMQEQPSAAPHASDEEARAEGTGKSASEGVNSQAQNQHLSTIIASTVAIVLSVVIVIAVFVLVKRFDLRPRVEKLVHANAVGGIFRCKKSDSGSSGSFYPPLTSSPTSTTVSGGTPSAANANSYLEQILRASQPTNDFHQIRATAQQAQPQQGLDARTLYRSGAILTASNGRQLVALNQCDPFGHHIYMEIDPVYAHLDSSVETHSDVQLSDMSDDDAHRRSAQHSYSGSGCSAVGQPPRFLGEDRPLIRSASRQQQQQQQQVVLSPHDVLAQQQQQQRLCMTASRGHMGAANSFRMAQTAQRRPRNASSQHHLVYPVNGLEAPISIALHGNDQFVSLKIDQEQQQHPQVHRNYK